MKKRKSLITILAFVLIIITTFSYSALSTRFQIVSDVVFRVDADIRVNDISLDSTSNGGLISFDSNYTKNTITSGFKLPNLNSSISYNVTITNKGNIDQAIYDLTTFSTSNDNIYYLIDDMPLNEALPMIVPFGTSKTIKITYKTTSPFTQTETIVNSFVFKKVYYVDYNLKGGSYTNDQNDLKNGQIKYEDVDLTLTNEKPIKNKYAFIGWTDEQNGTTVKYPSGSTYSLNKNIILYAVYRQGEATFLPGADFNAKIKQLANPNVQNIDINYDDTNITSIVRANTLPNGFTPTSDNVVSTSTSDFPIYAWYNNGTIYWYSDVDNPYININCNRMFNHLSNATSIDLSSINTSRTIDMSYMFAYSGFTSLNLSSFNTSNVTNMGSIFNLCSSLTNITFGNNFDTSNVTNMSYMFYGCSSLTTLNVSNFNTQNVTTMNRMFANCSSLTSIDISSFNTPKVTDIDSMFYNDISLQSITFGNNFDTSKVIYMGGMFWNCSSLTSLDLSHFDTSSVQYIHVMFRGCSSLTILDLSNFDLSSVIRKENMLLSMTSLTSLKTPNTYPSNLTIDLPKALYDVNGNEYTTLATGNPTETWLKLAYTVSFNSNGGTGTMSNQIIQYNTDTNLHTNTFTRTNYTFAGWNTRADGTGTAYLDGASVNALASANETITLYAQWAVISYTVTLDSNEGNIIDNVNLLSYETTMERNNDQYIVSGTTNTAGIYVPSEAFEGGKTYILRFKIQKVDGSLTALGGHLVHTQIYFKIDGSNSSSRYTDYYSTTNNIPNDTNVHTVELKFTYNGSTSGVDRNIYIQPNRAKTDYFKVKIFDVELEELSTTKTVNFGGTYGTLPTPTTPGYQFAGWNGKNLFEVGTLDDYYIYYQSGMNVSISNNKISSTILEGQMAFIRNEKHTYTAGNYVFKYQSSNGNKRHLIYPYDENGNILTDSDISISGWTYNQYYHGWFSNLLDLEYSTATIPEEVSYWKYGIVFIGAISEFGDTLEVSNIMIEEGSTATPYEPYYVTSSTPLTRNEDHTLYAKWTPNTYSVAFNKNDNAATGNMNNQSMTYGTSSNLTNNSYYKRGYKFVGWNTASDGTGTAYLNGASVSNLTNVNNGTVTLYAQWEKLMAEDIGHTIQDLNCEDVQCVIDELYYMLY